VFVGNNSGWMVWVCNVLISFFSSYNLVACLNLLHHDVLVFCSLIFPPFEYTEEERTLIAMRSDSAKISILIHLSDAPEGNNK
jgi:hypothetical protein